MTSLQRVTITTTYFALPKGVALDGPTHGMNFVVSVSAMDRAKGQVTITYPDGVTTKRKADETVVVFD